MNWKIFYTTVLLILLSYPLFASAKDSDNNTLSYDITSAGNPQQGYYIVEVTAYVSKKGDINMDMIRKCAVHGVIFRGFSRGQGGNAQKSMLNATQEQQYADFFNAFFKNDYLRYASAVDPSISTIKVGNQYAITATIHVAKDELRKTLEKAGVLKKLGF